MLLLVPTRRLHLGDPGRGTCVGHPDLGAGGPPGASPMSLRLRLKLSTIEALSPNIEDTVF